MKEAFRFVSGLLFMAAVAYLSMRMMIYVLEPQDVGTLFRKMDSELNTCLVDKETLERRITVMETIYDTVN